MRDNSQKPPKADVVPLRKPRSCPVCGGNSRAEWHPFCSKRCADIDLHRWLSGKYVISGGDDESATPRDDESAE